MRSLLLATTALLAQSVTAAVAPSFLDHLIADRELDARDLEERADNSPAEPTDPWVKVDDDGQPSTTYTPQFTTQASSTSLLDAAPHDLTASVYTWTTWAKVTTSTGDPPNPTATGKNGEGSFARCYNPDGENAPFCRPAFNSTLLTGRTYYVTWDPDFYNSSAVTASNTTVEVALRIEYFNTTDHADEWVKLETHNRVPAAWGFTPFKVEDKHRKGHKTNDVRIQLQRYTMGSDEITNSTEFLPFFIEEPAWSDKDTSPEPSHRDLMIALPVALGSVFFIVLGVCLWNRKTRKISLSGLGRTGYTGRRSRKEQGIPLQDSFRRDESPDVPDYRDYELEPPVAGRRDSDLGSLAGSPTTAVGDSWQQERAAGGNSFRDEIARQNDERKSEGKGKLLAGKRQIGDAWLRDARG